MMLVMLLVLLMMLIMCRRRMLILMLMLMLLKPGRAIGCDRGGRGRARVGVEQVAITDLSREW